jgi:hypothetical protein
MAGCPVVAGRVAELFVLGISDRESGVSARPIARQLSSVAGLYRYLT